MTGPAGQHARIPTGFLLGTATSAGQIEGASALDGRTPSIWDVFGAVPGRIADGSNPSTTVDHYHRWEQDLDLLAGLGASAYRFTLSWSRIQPRGAGAANPAGIGFYDRLIDGLLERGIAPFVGLHHTDMPLEVMEQGGWLTRSTVDAFAEYAVLAATAFGDRVAAWTTVDEPLLPTAYGYAVGIDAPGLTLLGGAFQAAHHQLLAHGRVTAVLRSAATGAVGILNQHTVVRPARPSGADRAAARWYDAYHNRQFADPVLLGSYPPSVLDMPDAATDTVLEGDLEAIAAPLDFYAMSYAHPTAVAAAPENSRIPFTLEVPAAADVTEAGWPVDAASLTTAVVTLTRRYPTLPPVYVVATGGAFGDIVTGGRPQPDLDRIAYLESHLAAVDAAIGQGCDVRGYFHSSLLDSWEWTEGFTRHSGLVRVDDALDRHPRASFGRFRDIIEGRR
ncbi:glycoside hydrolase family 1 protein [Nakamurella sp. GG22]